MNHDNFLSPDCYKINKFLIYSFRKIFKKCNKMQKNCKRNENNFIRGLKRVCVRDIRIVMIL